jgi:hypothetical protein
MVGESLVLAAIREIGFDERSWKVPWRRSCDSYNRPTAVHQRIDGSATDSLRRAGNDNELGHGDCCLSDVHADRLAAADTGNTSTKLFALQ